MDREGTNTALVIEGGGLRGAFVAGALHQMSQSGIQFDHVFATSAGAASAAYMIAGQMDRALWIWRERTHGAQLISPRNLLRGRRLMDIEGLVDAFRGDFALDAAALARSQTALTIAVTDCSTGRAAHVRADGVNVFDLLRATMALPVVYGRVATVEGRPYIDGGITDAIPIVAALRTQPRRLIVISTRPKGFRKTPPRIGANLLRHNYPTYPQLWPALRQRAEVYNRSIVKLESLERLGVAEVIRPERPLPASRLTRDRGRIIETLELGGEAARSVRP